MSAETKVILEQSIELPDLVEYLNTVSDCEVASCSEVDMMFEGCKTAFIRLTYKMNGRSLFWMNRKVIYTVHKKSGNTEDITSNTYLSLFSNENAIDLLTKIAKHYGGYLNENDCDENQYVEV